MMQNRIKEKNDFFKDESIFLFEDNYRGFIIDGNLVKDASMDNDFIEFNMLFEIVRIPHTDYNIKEFKRYWTLCEDEYLYS